MRLFPFFRKVALLEGVSYVLFGITMPLKYVYGILEPNFFVGMIHGLLFMVYCGAGLTCAIKFKWSFLFSFGVFIASLIPFGTFYLEAKHLRHLDH
jgi:integral membrane protein